MTDQTNDEVLTRYDDWLSDDGPAALVIREYLMPVEGNSHPIFPPTFAGAETSSDEDEEEIRGSYNVDSLPSGNICLIDTVGAQANRLEPLFKDGVLRELVPQISISAGKRWVNLLDAGHRAADAIVRFSELQPDLERAFLAILDKNNVEPLARIAPTSILFGVWDSRGTQAKLPRLVTSIIRAFSVEELTRSATFRAAVDYVGEGLIDEDLDKGEGKKNPLSREGMKYALATRTPGGVMVRGTIQWTATLNIAGIRALRACQDSNNIAVRRYILGLGLCVMTAAPRRELRQGCHLRLDESRPVESVLVSYSGSPRPVTVTHPEAVAFARKATEAFGKGDDRKVKFDPEYAQMWLKIPQKEQKKLGRAGKLGKEAIKEYLNASKSKGGGTRRARTAGQAEEQPD